MAVVRRDDRILAFANLLTTDAHEDAALDLMRYVPDAPPGTMDFLMASILLHLQAQGYRRFGLGMSPMAGMAERSGAPKWQRIARLVFEHGDRLLQLPRPAQLQGQVRARVGGAFPGGAARPRHRVHTGRRDHLDRRQGRAGNMSSHSKRAQPSGRIGRAGGCRWARSPRRPCLGRPRSPASPASPASSPDAAGIAHGLFTGIHVYRPDRPAPSS